MMLAYRLGTPAYDYADAAMMQKLSCLQAHAGMSSHAEQRCNSAHPKREGLGRCSQGALSEGALLPRLLPRGDSTLPDLPLPLAINSLPGGAELLC